MTDQEIKQKLKDLDKRLNLLERREQNITDSINNNTQLLKKIERAVGGEAMSGARGLVERMERAEDRLDILENFKSKLIYSTAGASGFVVLVIEILSRIII